MRGPDSEMVPSCLTGRVARSLRSPSESSSPLLVGGSAPWWWNELKASFTPNHPRAQCNTLRLPIGPATISPARY